MESRLIRACGGSFCSGQENSKCGREFFHWASLLFKMMSKANVRVQQLLQPQPPSVLAAMCSLGFHVTHTYGLFETYGPSTVYAWKLEWGLLLADERARLNARQGHLKNPKANAGAFENGWFHSGDLGVKHPEGYIEVKDRAKDIIILGGENISSLEVEVVYMHPAVLENSVVARADEQWGELPGYWDPKSVVFGPFPKTAAGKIKKHELRAKAKELGPVRKSRL
ncbi:hypothetical protein LUZ61_020571 [Rhynchospora tenuis]|uniref:Uncharacterized protein n=1 Tax=Rhynchospora tenuis TaxID=198213 RepID=A0AAD5ZDK0_9POAL|nr:hypothetical protein LUZ61_020571 [Rhynchospora tenuis]